MSDFEKRLEEIEACVSNLSRLGLGEDVKWLLTQVRRLQAENEKLREACSGIVAWYRTRKDDEGPVPLDAVFICARDALTQSTEKKP